jgi:hypothetical protein
LRLHGAAARVFEFDPRKNPHVVHESLEDMRADVDEKTFKREVLGEFVPVGEMVFHAWSPRLNVCEPTGREVTAEFLARHFGRDRGYQVAVGADFQLTPHMAAVIVRAFEAPGCPCGAPHLWYTDEVVVEKGDENDLVDALEEKGLDPKRTIVIADASGAWQDAERTKGRGSFDMFRRRGWLNIVPPDPKANRNPQVVERVKVANARMKSADEQRHLFSVPGNEALNRALRRWENKNGIPSRTSEWAHLCDAATYPLWRFFPRKAAPSRVEYQPVPAGRSERRSSFEGVI